MPELARAAADVADLAGLLPAGELPEPPAPAAPAPERLDGGWRLVLPLPFAERGAVDLTRWADDLVVTAAGVRRSLRLDPLLRRCEVTGGRLADPGTAAARLEVTFVADPGLWPADLLAAEERHDVSDRDRTGWTRPGGWWRASAPARTPPRRRPRRRRGRRPSDCRWCPLCQAAAVVRGERPEVSAALADMLTATAAALRSFAGEAGRRRRRAAPRRPGRGAGRPAPVVQHIELS